MCLQFDDICIIHNNVDENSTARNSIFDYINRTILMRIVSYYAYIMELQAY
jgi:hypothetical protein